MSPELVAALRETPAYALALTAGALPAEALCFALSEAHERFAKRSPMECGPIDVDGPREW